MQPSFLKGLQNKLQMLSLKQQSYISSKNSLQQPHTLPNQNKVQLSLDKQGRLNLKDEPNISIHDFKIIAVVGIGSYGKVKLVKMRTGDKIFAIKMLKKCQILRKNQLDHVKSQRHILSRIKFPFILSLKATFQDSKFIYLVTDYAHGGDLFQRLRKQGRFANDVSLFYMTQIILALNFLHENNIIYRDLKPQNLLIDRFGHIIIADFGFSKYLRDDRTNSICGTPQYLAPQLIKCYKSKGHYYYNKAVDWWALGILLYQMLIGFPPFFDKDPLVIYQKVEQGIIQFPKFIQNRAKDLIKKLLIPDPKNRIGSNDCGLSITKHKWFKGVNWQKVLSKEVPSPWLPCLKSQDDISHLQTISQPKQDVQSVPSQFNDQFQQF